MEISTCLAQARRWLAKTDNHLCRRYGLQVSHLTKERVSEVEKLTTWDSEVGEKHLGFKFAIIRHPSSNKVLKQYWKAYFDGSLVLIEEVPLTKAARNMKHQGKFIHRDQLWGNS